MTLVYILKKYDEHPGIESLCDCGVTQSKAVADAWVKGAGHRLIIPTPLYTHRGEVPATQLDPFTVCPN